MSRKDKSLGETDISFLRLFNFIGGNNEKILVHFIFSIFFEVLWVIGLAHSYNFLTWTLTVILIILSNTLMIKVAQVLPTTTVYTMFVGLGAGGTVVAEILFFGEPFNWLKIFLILILLTSVIGLMIVTDYEKQQSEARYES